MPWTTASTCFASGGSAISSGNGGTGGDGRGKPMTRQCGSRAGRTPVIRGRRDPGFINSPEESTPVLP